MAAAGAAIAGAARRCGGGRIRGGGARQPCAARTRSLHQCRLQPSQRAAARPFLCDCPLLRLASLQQCPRSGRDPIQPPLRRPRAVRRIRSAEAPRQRAAAAAGAARGRTASSSGLPSCPHAAISSSPRLRLRRGRAQMLRALLHLQREGVRCPLSVLRCPLSPAIRCPLPAVHCPNRCPRPLSVQSAGERWPPVCASLSRAPRSTLLRLAPGWPWQEAHRPRAGARI